MVTGIQRLLDRPSSGPGTIWSGYHCHDNASADVSHGCFWSTCRVCTGCLYAVQEYCSSHHPSCWSKPLRLTRKRLGKQSTCIHCAWLITYTFSIHKVWKAIEGTVIVQVKVTASPPCNLSLCMDSLINIKLASSRGMHKSKSRDNLDKTGNIYN